MLQNPYFILPILSCFCIWIWNRVYPRPYPGIPYNDESAKRVLGDLPLLLETLKSANDPAKFVFQQCRKLNSPVIQLFLKPFHKPIIFIDDVREVKDLIGLRTKEFDRAPSTRAVFEPLSPHSSIVKPTNLAWKDQRRYWEGLMGKPFLQDIVAPKMYDSALSLVALFKTKAALADGRPFLLSKDFDTSAFDIIWWSIMGSKLNGIQSQRTALIDAIGSQTQPASRDSPASIPSFPTPEIHQGMNYFIHSIEKTLRSFNQPWHHWALRQLPAYRRYWALKNSLLDSHIEETRNFYAKLTDEEASNHRENCALDIGVRRERLDFRDKFGKVAVPSTVELHDELFLFLIAGHDTTAVTLEWTVKFLTNYPDTQDKLRQSLKTAYDISKPQEPPSLQDILSKTVPYMDACLEEIVRLSNIHPRLVRIATQDTEVLGYPIPKGAEVLSSSYIGEKPLDVSENLRNRTSQQCKDNYKAHWDPNGMNDFIPERWLSEDGKFEPKNYPRLAFSAGPRICYGQKFALQELRITLTLLILSFKFEALPEGLNSMAGFQRVLRYPKQSYARLTILQ